VAAVVVPVVMVVMVVPQVLILAMVVLEFKFRSHQMDPTSTMLVEAAVVHGHLAHLLMLVMVALVEVVVVLPVERIHQKLVQVARMESLKVMMEPMEQQIEVVMVVLTPEAVVEEMASQTTVAQEMHKQVVVMAVLVLSSFHMSLDK
jgi:hypothetical protein|tara:strand:+ start:233 stop:673 length:441 start_codon:yes stop_codon:yes gene_type:complete